MRRIVSALLLLFPARFRKDFGEDMLATFDERWKESRSLRVAVRTLLDLVSSAALERISRPDQQPIAIRKGDNPMTVLWQDLRFALRTLLRTPGFTLVALLTLALGIGANTAMFSVANAVLWRSLPYPQPDRVMTVAEADGKDPRNVWGASYPNFIDWRTQSTAFEHLAAVSRDERILREGPEPVRMAGLSVMHAFFDVMGVQPALGRVFTAAEDKQGGAPVMVLSYRAWMQHFGGDPAVIGRTIRFERESFTAIGVMPPGFDYRRAEYWLPLEQVLDTYFMTRREVWVLDAVGRLRAGETAGHAQRELEGIMTRVHHDHPESDRGLVPRVSALRNDLSRDLRPALLVLMGAVGVVLLIACGNLAGLMSVRASGRAREMAIRSALGAGRHRLVRQLLTESALLSIAGGCAGVGLAWWATRSIGLLTKDSRLTQIPVNGEVLLFALAATLATSILFGVAPALNAARVNANEALKSGSRSGEGIRRILARQVLVIGQTALCLVLLVGAGLLLRSFRRVLEVDPGFRTDHLAAMRVSLPRAYNTKSADARVEVIGFYRQMLERMKALPGVSQATIVNSLPISGGDPIGDINIEGRPAAPGALGAASFRRAMPDYFQVMGIPVLRGRGFTDSDDASHPPVIIINSAMARRLWPNEDPIGRRITIGPSGSNPWVTIVGVVNDVRNAGLDREPGFSTYSPMLQIPWAQFELIVRTSGDPRSVIASVRGELRRLEPALMIDKVETMAQRIDESVAPRRLNLVLFGLFAGLALVLASVGLYGVVAYAAGQRTREFGLRMALGARPGDVLRLVLNQGLKLALTGVAIGMVAALGLARLLVSLLFGIQPSDPLTLAGVAVLLIGVALAACWLPAHRATRIAPVDALRTE